jgi:hypothetical protein
VECGAFNVKLLAAIVALWAIELLHLVSSLPREKKNPNAVVRGEHKVNQQLNGTS